MSVICIRKAVPDDLLIQMAEKLEPQFRQAFLDAVAKMQNSVSLDKLTAALAKGDVNQVLAVLGLDTKFVQALQGLGFQEGVASIRSAVQAVFAEAVALTLKTLPSRISVNLAFNLESPGAIKFLENYSLNLIKQITADTKEAVRNTVVRALREGGHPYEQAREIKQNIGLTARQEQAVANYRAALESGPNGRMQTALDRALRDGRFDPTVLRAIRNGKNLTQAQIAKMVSRYRERYIQYRAQMIARTETIRAANAGQHAVWSEAQKRGFIPANIQRVWIISGDDRTCFPAKTKVMTLEGWKPISRIKVGDKVLTHKDRFREVTATTCKHYCGPVVRLQGTDGMQVTATYGHRVLTVDGWKVVEKLTTKDRVVVMADHCERCGKDFPKRLRNPGAFCAKCAISEGNERRWSKPEEHQKLTEQNNQRWKDPKQKKKASDAVMNAGRTAKDYARQSESLRKRYAEDPDLRARMVANNQRTAQLPTHPFRMMTEEQRATNLHKVHVALGKNHRGGSFLEKKMRWFLTTQQIPFQVQWKYTYEDPSRRGERYGYSDFRVRGKKLIIECDGPFHEQEETRRRDLLKDEALAKKGFKVLRFTEEQIRKDFRSVADAIREQCCQTEHQFKRIKHGRIGHQPVYDLTVEEDASFVAGGIVVHNCDECLDLDGETAELGEEFSPGVLHPPAHPNCRCTTELDFGGTK